MTKAPKYQWGHREDRTGKKYKAAFAIEDLVFYHGVILNSAQLSHRNKQYFSLDWRDDNCGEVPTAVHATNALDSSGGFEFGVERALIADGIVSEVLILCGQRDFFYRIPVAEWKQIDPDPISRDRYVSVVNSNHTIAKTGFSLLQFKHDLDWALNHPGGE